MLPKRAITIIKMAIVSLTILVCLGIQETSARPAYRRPVNPRGVADPRGPLDPRGPYDPRGVADPS